MIQDTTPAGSSSKARLLHSRKSRQRLQCLSRTISKNAHRNREEEVIKLLNSSLAPMSPEATPDSKRTQHSKLTGKEEAERGFPQTQNAKRKATAMSYQQQNLQRASSGTRPDLSFSKTNKKPKQKATSSRGNKRDLVFSTNTKKKATQCSVPYIESQEHLFLSRTKENSSI